MLMAFFGVEIEGDIFAFLVERHLSSATQTFCQRGLTLELMRKLVRRNHRFGVRAGGPRQTGVKAEGWSASLGSGLIRQSQENLLRFGIVLGERNVSGGVGDGP